MLNSGFFPAPAAMMQVKGEVKKGPPVIILKIDDK
jgi:hypothetical protein